MLVQLVAMVVGIDAAFEDVCYAISTAASDDWCESNCNYVPSNCPASLCYCGPPPPTPAPTPHDGVFGAYYANWAQYRAAPYKHTARDVAGLQGIADHIYFGFVYFCPPSGTTTMPYWGQSPYGSCSDSNEYSLMTLEYNDPKSIATLVKQGFKVMASIGGWNFPSHYFSEMVGSQTSRTKFIQSAKAFLTQYGFAGIDLDWEFPCSAPRDNTVKITNTKFRYVHDDGGQCPRDTTGLTALLKEMREAMPDMYISVASQAAEKNWINMGIGPDQAQYLDHYHIMNYDYTVSDLAEQQPLSPNQPLYNPPLPSPQWSINYTVQGYLAAGVPPAKMMVGLAMYGHTWYKKDFSDWKKFGAAAEMQGSCYGPFKDTYGGAPGTGSRQCGTLMLSEIEAAIGTGNGGCETYHDEATQSDIAYCASTGADGTTAAGTWIAYQGKESTEAVVDYGMKLGLGGFFTWDTSMDSLSPGFKLHNAIMDRMATSEPTPTPTPSPAPAPGPVPTPSPTPTPPTTTTTTTTTTTSKMPSTPACCWSAWGSSDSCGFYPSGHGGARCNTDWDKTCSSNSDCGISAVVVL